MRKVEDNAGLEQARANLAQAEATLMTDDGLAHLQEGLARLELLLESGPSTSSIARNLGTAYAARIYRRVSDLVAGQRNLPETELKHVFEVMRAFDDLPFELPEESRELKIDVVKRLVDLYYEGYSAAEKESVYRQLAELAEGTTLP